MGDEWVTWKKMTYLLSSHDIPKKEEAERIHFGEAKSDFGFYMDEHIVFDPKNYQLYEPETK